MATNRFQEEVNRQDSLKTSSMYNQPTTPTANTTSTANTTPVANTTPIDNTSGVFGTPKVDNVVSTSDLSKPPVNVVDNSALVGKIQDTLGKAPTAKLTADGASSYFRNFRMYYDMTIVNLSEVL